MPSIVINLEIPLTSLLQKKKKKDWLKPFIPFQY